MASAMVVSISIRSRSASPVSGQLSGELKPQPCINVSCKRLKSPLFQAESRILARCSETGADFIFIIIRMDRRTYRTGGRSVYDFFGTPGLPVPKVACLHFLNKKV